MNALKIVCEHYDTEIIDKVKLTNNHINKFEEKKSFIINELVNILWVSRRPNCNEEEFYDRYNKYINISDDKKKELWDNCKNTREKYKELFDLFDDEESGYDNYTMFLGLVGGIRAIGKLYYECDLIHLEENPDYWEALLDDDEIKSDNPAKIGREKLIERTTDDIFNLKLFLDT